MTPRDNLTTAPYNGVAISQGTGIKSPRVVSDKPLVHILGGRVGREHSRLAKASVENISILL